MTGRRHLPLTTALASVVLLVASVLGGRPDQILPTTGPGWPESGTAAVIADQASRLPAVPAGQVRVRNNKGTPGLPPSAWADLDIPVTALLAYQGAAAVMERVSRRCGLSWTLLAAIGRVESDHGRAGGAQLRSDGTSSRPVRGIALDGRGPVARIPDTDAGLLDGDVTWDRAVGPMQFLPSTWSMVAVDADGDAVRSPDDIEDAALAAAVLLCSAPGRLDTASGRRTAVFRYNPSDSYVASVLALERSYRAGEFDVPGDLAAASTVTVLALGTDVSAPVLRPQPDARPEPDRTPTATASPGPHEPPPAPDQEPAPEPTDSPDPAPEPDPTEPPDPAPEPEPTDPPAPEPEPTDPPDPEPNTPDPATPPEPTTVELTGVLSACGPAQDLWCLGEQLLDLGGADFLAGLAGEDYDADGAVESRTDELTGLAGREVTVVVAAGTDPAFVEAINGLSYDPDR